MSQNTFRKKLTSGNTSKTGSRKSIFTWIEEKLDVTGILGEGVPVQLVPPIGFITLLALIYIWGNHRAENMVRKIEKAQQEVEDLRADVDHAGGRIYAQQHAVRSGKACSCARIGRIKSTSY